VPVVGCVWASLVAAGLAQNHHLRLCRDEKPRRNLSAFVPVSQALPALALFLAHVVSFSSAT
jgi:hypothetical protein